MASDVAISLSTRVVEGKKGLIDGAEFTILGPDHLSPDDETTAMALFSRAEQLAEALANEPNKTKGKLIAERLRATQFEVFGMLTDLSQDQIKSLPPTKRVRLMETIEAITKAADEDEDAGVETPSTPTPNAQSAAAAEVEQRFGGTD